MSAKHNCYLGRSGQLAVMARLLKRGYNVAVPEVDRGDDLYVVHDDYGELTRVQVKGATAKGKKRLSAAFNISLAQLQRPHHPELVYVLALMHGDVWGDFLVIPRPDLDRLRAIESMGHVTQDGRRLLLYVSFSPDGVWCNGICLTRYREDWSKWPVEYE
jgi:hypothetical protein